MTTSKLINLGDIAVVLSRAEGPPATEEDIRAALMLKLHPQKPIRVNENSSYKVTSIIIKDSE